MIPLSDVIPAKAGIYLFVNSFRSKAGHHWIPAFAGMTGLKLRQEQQGGAS